jgi:glycosyltransferase involved in cell wall biosynthesis
LFLGSLPPPYIGPTLATEVILNSSLKERFNLIHLDTSDHRSLKTLSRIDFQNIHGAIQTYFRLLVKLVAERPDVVYIPISQTTIGYLRDSFYIIVSKVFGKKVICHLRGGNFKRWYDSSSWLMRLYARCCHRLVDGQIVLGENLRGLFEGLMPGHRIFVVPNGKDYLITSDPRPVTSRTRVLYLSNFIVSKGFGDVLEAAPVVFEETQSVEFLLAGEAVDSQTQELVDQYRKRYAQLPIMIRDIMAGSEKQQAFASSDIFVFPTYYPPEGHPWVIIEAMAGGLPIISTDQGAITESVIDGVNGFIVDKKNPQQIAEKILYLIENPDLRIQMGRASRELYLQKFTEEKMVERLAACFNAVLSTK